MNKSLRERFSNKYISLTESGCWVWIGSLTNGGYGRIREGSTGSKTILAHRASWQLHNGEIPKDLLVLHKCDVRCCVNPAHLFIGTYSDNAKDRENKNRGADQRGMNNPGSKLTDQLVVRIRLMRAKGLTFSCISSKMKIPNSTIFNVCKNTWKHIGE